MKKVLALILVCIMALMAAGCSTATGKYESILKKGKIEVSTASDFPPFEFPGADGVQGVDIEIAKAIAAELGVDVVINESNFDSILMDIKSGKGDIAISGFTITDERKASVDFSDPYIDSVQYLILPEGSDIVVLEDLAGKKIGVALGYTGQFLIEDELAEGGALEGTNKDNMKIYNSAREAALDLKAGRIDAVVMDEYVAKNIASKDSGIEAKELRYENGEIASEEYGVMVAKGNEDLLLIINKVIKNLIGLGKIREWVIQYSE